MEPDCDLHNRSFNTTALFQFIVVEAVLEDFDEPLSPRPTMADQLDSALDLLRRLKPQDIASNLQTIIDTVPDLTEDLLASVDQPLKIKICKSSHKDYLCCDYNRDVDSYRSPWSNEFDPPIPDGTVPSASLRKLEVAANDAFDIYRDLYYEGGISSVYFWDLDDGFAGVVLLKKTSNSGKNEGGWDSIHVFEAIERGRSSQYKLTSTVMLHMLSDNPTLGKMDLSGNMTRQVEQEMEVKDKSDHLANIGRLVEDMELKMRNQLQEVYFGKTKDIVNDLRSIQKLSEVKDEEAKQREVMKSMNK